MCVLELSKSLGVKDAPLRSSPGMVSDTLPQPVTRAAQARERKRSGKRKVDRSGIVATQHGGQPSIVQRDKAGSRENPMAGRFTIETIAFSACWSMV